MTPSHPQNPQGFTLIEVLVAMVIFTTAITVLAEAYLNTIQAFQGQPEKTLVEQDLAFVRQRVLRAPDFETLERGGDIETFEAGMATWEAEYEETNVIDLFKVTIEIELGERDEVYIQELYLLRPGWSDPADRETLLNDKTSDLESARSGLEWYEG